VLVSSIYSCLALTTQQNQSAELRARLVPASGGTIFRTAQVGTRMMKSRSPKPLW
jgi:hypothetical protein